jgi:hypothetical protein
MGSFLYDFAFSGITLHISSYKYLQWHTKSTLVVGVFNKSVRTSETSVDNNFTRQYIPEDNSEQNNKYAVFEGGPVCPDFCVIRGKYRSRKEEGDLTYS